MSATRLLPHAISFSIIVFLFGSVIYSASADFSQHYALLSELMTNGTSHSSHLGILWNYPRLSYFIAAAFGHLIQSDLFSMWIVCLASIYVSYCAAILLAADELGLGAAILFVTIVIVALPSKSLVGFEVIENFFYAQIVATSFYFSMLLFLTKGDQSRQGLRLLLVIGMIAIMIEIHAVAALHMAATYTLMLVVELVLEITQTKRLNTASAVRLFGFIIAVASYSWISPTMMEMRSLSQHEGALALGLAARTIIIVSIVTAALCGLAALLSLKINQKIPAADRTVLSALSAAIILSLMQYFAFLFFDLGSLYSVKKHFYILGTLTAIALARFLAVAVRGLPIRRAAQIPLNVFLTACALVVLMSAMFDRPGISLYPLDRATKYARMAASFTFPAFEPGNTAVFAASLHSTFQYMISIGQFQARAADGPTVGLLSDSFVPELDSKFVMVDRSQRINRECKERYSESASFVIIPSSCLSVFGSKVSFALGKAGTAHLVGDWWPAEPWGVWGNGNANSVEFEVPEDLRTSDLELLLNSSALLTDEKRTLTFDILVNDIAVETIVQPKVTGTFKIRIPAAANSRPILKITFATRDAVSPFYLGINADSRALGVGLNWMMLSKRDMMPLASKSP